MTFWYIVDVGILSIVSTDLRKKIRNPPKKPDKSRNQYGVNHQFWTNSSIFFSKLKKTGTPKKWEGFPSQPVFHPKVFFLSKGPGSVAGAEADAARAYRGPSCWDIPHGQSTWHSPQKVGKYRTYINQYMVTVPSTFTLVYMGSSGFSYVDTQEMIW